jgi:protein deglycase
MRKKILVAVADGVEEIETVVPIDVLRRAGAEITVAAVASLNIAASRGVNLVADKLIRECVDDKYDLIVVPGGAPGAENLRDCAELTALLKKQYAENRLYAAICAAPVVVLQHHGLLHGVARATCHPALAKELYNNVDERVVVDKNCITSQGPGTAMEFSLKLVDLLFGNDMVAKLKKSMVV